MGRLMPINVAAVVDGPSFNPPIVCVFRIKCNPLLKNNERHQRLCRFDTVSAERLGSPTFPWSVKAAGSPVEGALRSDPERRTYTNMAVPWPAEALCLLLLCVSGLRSSTLHLPPGPLRTLPQDRGFFTVGASVGLAGGDGGAPAARAASEGGSSSGASPLHRSRRSPGEPAMPKVYGQVRWREFPTRCITSRWPFWRGSGGVMQTPPPPPPVCCFLSRIISCNLMLKNARLLHDCLPLCARACARGI